VAPMNWRILNLEVRATAAKIPIDNPIRMAKKEISTVRKTPLRNKGRFLIITERSNW
jgi:hypothetical protein